jgi:hypothetical protein
VSDAHLDRINAVLAAAGYNFSLLLRWFQELLRALLLILRRGLPPLCQSGHQKCSSRTAILSQILTLYSRPIIYLYI